MATAHQGRAGNGPAATPFDIARGQPDHLQTRMTGTPGGTPTGPLTEWTADMTADHRRSIIRENEAAAILANNGYKVKQNPTKNEVAESRRATGDEGDPEKNPDYLIEGRVFDCYSPNPEKDVRGVWTETKKKPQKLQTQRVVVDLMHWNGSMSELRRQFIDWPAVGLKEVKAILPNGTTVQIDLPRPRD